MMNVAARLTTCLVAAAATFAAPLAEAAVNASNVPSFNAGEQTNDLDKHEGSEWPDEGQLEWAFQSQFDRFDECVVAEKQRIRSQKRLTGEATVQVLLNPHGRVPLGLNTTMPKRYSKRSSFVSCLRTAAAEAPYPAYDGPPLVVDFEFELDPGYDVVVE